MMFAMYLLHASGLQRQQTSCNNSVYLQLVGEI